MRENLKNVMLFMSSSGYLVPPKQDPSKENLWTETWKRIDRFLPDLRGELSFEEEPEEEPVKEEQDAEQAVEQDSEQAPVPTEASETSKEETV